MKKFVYLESLRGLAALAVVLAHFVIAFYPSLYYGITDAAQQVHPVAVMISGTPLNLLYNGSFSVAIFFLLSGYVLTYKFFKDSGHDIFFVPIAVKRYVRLLLPVLFSIFLSYLAMSLHLYYKQPATTLPKAMAWLDGFWNFEPSLAGMLQESFYGVFFKREVTYNGVLWTMYYEFLGSLLVYGFVALLRNSRKRYLGYIAGILIFRHAHYLAFMLGMLLSDISARQSAWFSKRHNPIIFVLLLLLGLFIGSYPVEIPVKGTMYAFMDGLARTRTYQIVGAALVMTALLKLSWLQSFLSRKPLALLGKISFSLYLLHMIVIASLSSHLFAAFYRYTSYHHAAIVTFVVSLPLIVIASYFTHVYVDATSVRVAQWVYDRTLAVTTKLDSPLTFLVPSFLRSRGNRQNAPEEASVAPLPTGQGAKQDL